MDFGEWDKNFDLFSYIDKVYKIVDKNGSFVVFNDWKNLGDISRYAESLGFVTKDMIRLEKTNPMPRNRDRRYITDFECAIWFTMPGAKWVFNRQSDAYERPKYVGSIEKGLHPTQKNLGLMEWLIKIHRNENDEEFKEGFIVIENEDQVSCKDAFEFVKKVNYRIQKAIKENDPIIDLDREFFIAAVKQTEAFLSNEKEL